MFFPKVLRPFSKMDIYKCPKSLLPLTFPDTFSHFLEYILEKLLKETYYQLFLSIVTSLAIFFTILSAFSASLSPEPPIASIII